MRAGRAPRRATARRATWLALVAALVVGSPLVLCTPPDSGRATQRDPADGVQDEGTDGAEARGDQDAIVPPPPKRPVAGMRGFAATSTVVFASAPDRPHTVEAIYVFPDRARWTLISSERAFGRRTRRYRYGDHVFGLDPRAPESQEYSGSDADLVALQLELRRAVMMWPDGFAWKPTEHGRRADLPGRGHLVAHLPEGSERPEAVESRLGDGALFEAFTGIEWGAPQKERVWPAAMTFSTAGTPVWRETIDAVDSTGRFVEGFFLPPDRRDYGRSRPVTGRATPLDLPGHVGLRVPIEVEDWEGAIAACARVREELQQELSRPLLRQLAVEVDERARPRAYLARLADARGAVPEGWTRTPPRAGSSLVVRRLSGLTPAVLEELRADLPEGARPGRIHVRINPDDRTVLPRLVLPLLPD